MLCFTRWFARQQMRRMNIFTTATSSPIHNAFIRTKTFTDAGFFTNAGYFTDVLCVARWFAKQQMRRIIHSLKELSLSGIFEVCLRIFTTTKQINVPIFFTTTTLYMRLDTQIKGAESVWNIRGVSTHLYYYKKNTPTIFFTSIRFYIWSNPQPERAESVWNIRGVSTHLYYFQTHYHYDIFYYYSLFHGRWDSKWLEMVIGMKIEILIGIMKLLL